jgi:hypothetical protein
MKKSLTAADEVTFELVNGVEEYTMPEGHTAFGLMLFVKRTPRVVFNILRKDGKNVTRIHCYWSEEYGRYREDEAR